jgi:superfamily II DNA or RNA helicase
VFVHGVQVISAIGGNTIEMHEKKYKDPYEFWSYRDVRKEKFPPVKVVPVPQIATEISKQIEILLSHHYLVPLKETPESVIDYFKKSLTIPNPEFQNYIKFGHGFVPKHIKPYIKMYVIDSEYLGLPRSINWGDVQNAFQRVGIAARLRDIRPTYVPIQLSKNDKFEPIFYQKEAIRLINAGNVVLEFFCGKGKTTLTLFAINIIRYRTLILVRTNLLIRQWKAEILKFFNISEKEIGIINGDSKTEGIITLASVQSLIKFSREEKRRLSEAYSHVICDEVHEVPGKQYFELVKIFKCRRITGLTATPIRSDGKSRIIASYIGTITKVDDGGIIPVDFDITDTNFEFQRDGRKWQYNQMLDALIIDEERNDLIVKKIQYYLKKDATIFVFSCRIKHLEILQGLINITMPHIKTGLIVDKTTDGKKVTAAEQDEIQRKVDSQEIKVVFGTTIIKQGFNVQPLSVCMIASPQKSRILVEQIIGRAQRQFKDKERTVLVDFVDRKVKTLLYQFYYKNKKIYRKFRELSYDSRKTLETTKQ